MSRQSQISELERDGDYMIVPGGVSIIDLPSAPPNNMNNERRATSTVYDFLSVAQGVAIATAGATYLGDNLQKGVMALGCSYIMLGIINRGEWAVKKTYKSLGGIVKLIFGIF